MFVGNQTTCLKILPSQIQFIVDLAALHQERAPQFLDLLKCIVKVEGLGLTLKRNQAYVMKYIMQVRACFCCWRTANVCGTLLCISGGECSVSSGSVVLICCCRSCSAAYADDEGARYNVRDSNILSLFLSNTLQYLTIRKSVYTRVNVSNSTSTCVTSAHVCDLCRTTIRSPTFWISREMRGKRSCAATRARHTSLTSSTSLTCSQPVRR